MRPVAHLPRTIFLIGVIAVCLATLVFRATLANGKKDEQTVAQALLDKAADITNIEAAGGAPFLLVAKTSWTQYGKTSNGQFALAWQAPDRYRRETALPGFIEAVVVAGDVLYRTRNLGYIPLAMVRPSSLLQVPGTFTNWPRKEMTMDTGQPPKELVGASNFRCVSAVTEFNRASVRHVACFENGTGSPLIEQQQLSSGGTETLTYANYASVNGKEFPRTIKYQDTAGIHGDVEITKLEAAASFPDATFQQPVQSIKQLWCPTPKATNAPLPSWALDNWLKWAPGPNPQLDDPVAFVAVNAKGGVQNVVLLDDSASAGERTAASLIRKDKFPVETCGGTPVPYETVVRLIRTSDRGPLWMVERPITN